MEYPPEQKGSVVMEWIRSVKAAFIAVSAALIALGVWLLVKPGVSSATICVVLGTVAVIYGIVKILGYFSKDQYRLAFQFDLAVGILSIVLGVVLILRPDAVLSFLPTVIGVFILVDSILRFQTAIDAKHFGMRKWWAILLISCVGAALGGMLLFHPFEGAMAMIRLIGLTLVIDGAENLVTCLYTVKVPRRSGADPTVIDADFTEVDDD